jgi:hypothetical protein
MMKRFLSYAFALVSSILPAAISVTVEVNPNPIPISIGVADLQSALPGSDFVPYRRFERRNPAAITRFRFTVTATGAQANRTWYVSVSRTTSNWGPEVPLSLARTNDGTGTGTINGTTYDYTVIDAGNKQVFSGTRTRNRVGLSLQVDLAAEALEAKTYSTRLTYTVVAP